MAKAKSTRRTCRNGHKFYKSSDCPTCPICEQEKKYGTGFLSTLSAPARRALENNGIHTVKQLAKFTEKEILTFHGMGPASIPTLKIALKKANLEFRKTGLK